jgi:DNA-binding response OmpR family regulator
MGLECVAVNGRPVRLTPTEYELLRFLALGDDPANPRYIVNEPGVGYRLED